MSAPLEIVRVRRNYNQWVANQTLEDYALRFTAKKARKWSAFRVANTASGAISFLALEAIGGAITVSYGFPNAAAAIIVVSLIIFLVSIPITYYAARYGVDIDLLTRGAGFGYLGSTLTSLIYASFTFLFFAIEAAIMSLALELCFGVPLTAGYIISSIIIIPLVTHGITLISLIQLWTQPLWIFLHIVPFVFIAATNGEAISDWTTYKGQLSDGSFDLVHFGLAATVVFSLVAQIGEQVDFLRFLPPLKAENRKSWWAAAMVAGPGWIVIGAIKMLAGSLLAFLAVQQMVPPEKAAEPTQMYLVAFGYVFSSPQWALACTGAFVIVSQIKINITNSYAGSIAWSNFFSRLTHSHPGRVVWLVFNVAIALILMELGIYRGLEAILGLYSMVAVAWIGALVADLVINKSLGLSPPHIEFKRAHLYDVNPVGVGAMLFSAILAIICYAELLGPTLRALAPFVALFAALISSPLIALATRSRWYIARRPSAAQPHTCDIDCVICEYAFEPEDTVHCPVYGGNICSLCCSLDARCHDSCKPQSRVSDQAAAVLKATLPVAIAARVNSRLGHYIGIVLLLGLVIAAALALIYVQATLSPDVPKELVRTTLWTAFCILMIIAGVASWLLVLAQESRHVAQQESDRQTSLLRKEIEAHKATDSQLQKAKEAAESANQAKSRYVVSISHELRTPLNAIFGYAQILQADDSIPLHRRNAIRVVHRSAEHLCSLIDGLLDIARIEAGKFHLTRSEVRLTEFLDEIVAMFHLQASAKNLNFVFSTTGRLPAAVYTDEQRLRQVLINLLANAIKFTERGQVSLSVRYGAEVAEFEISDTGRGIAPEDIERIFEPFVRGSSSNGGGSGAGGVGLGLTITKLLTKIMGGNLSVRSVVGQGTTFTLKLLLYAVAPSRNPVPTVKTRVGGYEGERRSVLVMDDQPEHCTLVSELLTPLGFQVFTATDAEWCLKLADDCDPDLILLDVSMPDISGLEVAQRLRADPMRKAAIVMLSANPPERTPDEAALAPYDAYVMKPISMPRLLTTLAETLSLRWTDAQAISLPEERLSEFATRMDVSRLDDLARLCEIGHIRGLHSKLDQIEASDPSLSELIGKLRDMIAGFDLKAFASAVEELRDAAARV